MKRPRPQKSRNSQPTAELLLEIGVEELPYEFVKPALSSLEVQVDTLFTFHNLSYDPPRVYGTPRRLVLFVEGLTIHQKASTNEVMGPSKSVAYDQAGQPTKAAIGFARGQGIPVEALEVQQTPKGEYVFAVKEDKGRPTMAVLSEIIPNALSELSFPKAMKWNETNFRFARPVRWIMALFGGKVVPVQLASIKAGNRTYGHRVMGGGKSIVVHDFKTYNKGLEKLKVIVDPEHRRATIRKQIDRLCAKAGVDLNADDALLEQAVYTTEWPCAVLGSFKPEYLTVPQEVLITSMKQHQGFFSVRDKESGRLAPHFIAVANNELKNMSLIRTGNERVLAARLADAQFFFNEDQRVTLEERAKKLSGVLFHQKLGTMANKQERLVKLVSIIASALNIDNELVTQCSRAAALCKADLLTGIVGEFPELQGILGGYYAQHDGESREVFEAIRDQYIPRGMEGGVPETIEGLVLGLADRLDTIAAFFLAGIIPKGSEDPFALRRHALSVVRIILEGNIRLNLYEVVEKTKEIVEKDVKLASSVGQDPLSFIIERFRYYMGVSENLRDDVIHAVTGYQTKDCDLVDLAGRMRSLQATTLLPEFDPLMVGFNRANNILKKEGVKTTELPPVAPSLFQDDAERELHVQLISMQERYDGLLKKHQYKEALLCSVQLKPYIDRFFESVMVNVQDPALRNNRLSLLRHVVDGFFGKFADFSQIMVQGR
ncbi:MAG: glycine--tRNA ligase subunit beta [Nitrospira sp.]|nr:glycine--tRNA ligase subunit beta [Nitrospira sp.]